MKARGVDSPFARCGDFYRGRAPGNLDAAWLSHCLTVLSEVRGGLESLQEALAADGALTVVLAMHLEDLRGAIDEAVTFPGVEICQTAEGGAG